MKDEDIRAQVIKVLGKIAPEMESKMEDVVHRLGKKRDNKVRNVIVL